MSTRVSLSSLSVKLVTVITVFSLLFLCSTASAQAPGSLRQQLKVISEGGYPALLDKTHREGSVRLIVTLDMPFRAMGHLQVYDAQHQFGTIADMQKEVHSSLSGFSISDVTNFKYVPQISMTVDRSALEKLVTNPFVKSLAEDALLRYTLDTSVPKIGAPKVWNAGFTGAGSVIGILDTGVDKNHPFLNGAVVSEACYSSNYQPHSASSVCPGGVTSSTAQGSAMPYSGNCYPGTCDHGTHVAGIAAGRDNGSFSGVATGAGVIAVQVFSRFDDVSLCGPGATPCAMAYTSDIIKGLERILSLRDVYSIAAVNLSLGGGRYYNYCDSDPMKPSIDNLRSVNIATVAASGNASYKDSIASPACISSAISVGASSDIDTVPSFSNSAYFLSLLAPGVGIYSSIPGGTYESWSGTSMATPHITGSWALLRQAAPSQSVSQVLNAMATTGLGIVDINGIYKTRIRVDNALAAIDAMLEEYPVVGDWSGTGLVRSIGEYWNGSWFFDMNGNGAWDGSSIDRYYPDFGVGLTSAFPVVGDWSGTGETKIGVYWNGSWFLDMNGNGAWDGSSIDRYYPDFGVGLTGAFPVVGDWSGTGETKIGVYWNGSWFLDMNGNGAWNGSSIDRYYPDF